MSHVSTMFSIRKNATGQGDDYKTGCLSDYSYFKEIYKLIAMILVNNRHLIVNLTQYSKLI